MGRYDFYNIDFPYLFSKRNRILHLGITLVLSIFFIIVLQVFNLSKEVIFPLWLSSLGLGGVIILGVMIMAVSQLVILPQVKVRQFKLWHIIGWLWLEIIVITIIITLIYGGKFVWYLFEWYSTFKYTALILVLPYSFSLLIISLINVKLKSKSITENDTVSNISDLITFSDERSHVKLSVKRSNVLYLEASDNYVSVYFFEEGSVKHELVRTTLKRSEHELSDKGLVRCHRSFIVNIENVEWLKKQGRGYKLKIHNINTPIPVSRSFVPSFISLIVT